MAAWRVAWLLLFRPSPKPLKMWRLMLLRLFGARITGRPFVASSARVRIPWLLTMEAGSCLGEHAEVYNLARVRLGPRCVVAQHTYLCAGTHDLEDPELPLVVGPIDVGADAFVGAKALVLPGVVIGEGAVVGAGSVVTRDLPAWTVCAGNPCRPLRPRPWSGQRSDAG
jgi:putative colanic acid biosynthesis acetyltransferase WcaF